MNAFVFVLILFLSPDGAIVGYAEGVAADVAMCHQMIDAKLKMHDVVPEGTKPKGICINNKPLPSDESNHFQPRPPLSTNSVTI